MSQTLSEEPFGLSILALGHSGPFGNRTLGLASSIQRFKRRDVINVGAASTRSLDLGGLTNLAVLERMKASEGRLRLVEMLHIEPNQIRAARGAPAKQMRKSLRPRTPAVSSLQRRSTRWASAVMIWLWSGGGGAPSVLSTPFKIPQKCRSNILQFCRLGVCARTNLERLGRDG
jgi:hypothetical protein